MKQIRGFTLIELAVTLAILAIIAAFAVPSFHNVIVNARIDGSVSQIRNAIAFARSEAINRQANITICSSTDNKKCSGLPDWSDGWIVFVDLNKNDTVEEAETLKVWPDGVSGSGALKETSVPSRSAITFIETGAISHATNPPMLTLDPSGSCVDGERRIIKVTAIGRFTVSKGDCPS